MSTYNTRYGSLKTFDKGGVQVTEGDPKHYAFSNLFEVASKATPWEKVAVAKNFEYVLEAIRAEGKSPWRLAVCDEFALIMDGCVEIELLDPDQGVVDRQNPVSKNIAGEPQGEFMGKIVARRGHMALLPANRCYRFRSEHPSVLLLQTIESADTVYRWSDICQHDRK